MSEEQRPIDMLLFCPRCDMSHVDAPNAAKNWDNPPHRTHECQHCGYVWRPADVATNGVRALKTKGLEDRSPSPYTAKTIKTPGRRS